MKHTQILIAAIAAIALCSCEMKNDNSQYEEAKKYMTVDFDYEFESSDADSLTVTFTSTYSPFMFLTGWYFGDNYQVTYPVGYDSPAKRITHKYEEPGVYNVSLSCYEKCWGTTISNTKQVKVGK